MVGKPLDRSVKILLGVFAIGLLLLGYTWLSSHQHRLNPNDTTIPTWSQLLEGVKSIVTVSVDDIRRWTEARTNNPEAERPRSWLMKDAEATGTRFCLGVGFSTLVAVFFGLLMGCSRTAEAFLVPPVVFLAKIAPTAALPVFFALIHTDVATYTAMVVFGIAPVIAQTVYLAARDISDEYFHKAFTLGASKWAAVRYVMFPFVQPKIIDAIRLAFGPAIVYLVAAEALFSDNGFGYTIRMQARLLNMSVVYPYLVILATFASVMDYGLRFLQKRICRWYSREEEE